MSPEQQKSTKKHDMALALANVALTATTAIVGTYDTYQDAPEYVAAYHQQMDSFKLGDAADAQRDLAEQSQRQQVTERHERRADKLDRRADVRGDAALDTMNSTFDVRTGIVLGAGIGSTVLKFRAKDRKKNHPYPVW